jgi:hypothetical protein
MSTLCSACQKLIQPLSQVHYWAAGMLPHPHHNSISDLQSAVERGCPLCKLVWKSLTSQEKMVLCCERSTLENRSAAVRSFVWYSRLDGTIINFTLQPPDKEDIQISKQSAFKPFTVSRSYQIEFRQPLIVCQPTPSWNIVGKPCAGIQALMR